jgi:hypothetical protein
MTDYSIGQEISESKNSRTRFAGGGVRDGNASKKPRFDLLYPKNQPYERQMMTRFAEWMRRGAEKYPQYQECDCAAIMKTEESTPKISAETATSASSGPETPSLRNDSGSILASGRRNPETYNVNTNPTEYGQRNASIDGRTTDSRNPSSKHSSMRDALSVENSLRMSTTTTRTVQSEKDVVSASERGFATDATSDSDTTKGGSNSTGMLHWPTCSSRLKTPGGGGRNWEQFSSEDALQHAEASLGRHYAQYVTGDTSEDHAAAIWFNVMCLEYVKQRIEGEF